MASFETYVFFLCLIVFIALTISFAAMLTIIVKQELRLIRSGLEDDRILKGSEKPNRSRFTAVCSDVITVLLCIVLLAAFVLSMYEKVNEKSLIEGMPSLKVVKSSSMAEKNERNKYLVENGLDDQLQTFDLVVVHPLPDENELKLYDIVIYEIDDIVVMHRIVSITEPDEKEPYRSFRLQGDAIPIPDTSPVRYSQMRGIYRGERIPFLGNFILFMQSPAGWLCVFLFIGYCIVIPFIEKKVESEQELRRKKIEHRNSEEKESVGV